MQIQPGTEGEGSIHITASQIIHNLNAADSKLVRKPNRMFMCYVLCYVMFYVIIVL